MTLNSLSIDTSTRGSYPKGTVAVFVSTSNQTFSGTIKYDGTHIANVTINGASTNIDLDSTADAAAIF